MDHFTALNICFWTVIGSFVLWSGCHRTTLAPDGIYKGNKFLFESDRNLQDSKKSLGEFVNWTRINYEWLHTHGRDDVIASADSVRTNAPMWYSNAWTIRATYTNALYSGMSEGTIGSFSNSFYSIVSAIKTIQKQNRAIASSITIPTNP